MIVVTGGAGFIGSAFVWRLNREGIDDILVVDRLGSTDKWKNLVNRRFAAYLPKGEFLERVVRGDDFGGSVEAVVHMGACSSTTERDADYLMANNAEYSLRVAEWALDRGARFVYASSGATYGDGSQGFSDDDETTRRLFPLNMYGYSKQLFDLWVLRRGWSGRVAGLKFFNVYGPNEYHKGDMASVVFKAFHQIRATGRMRLFKSYRPDYGDGQQVRDFVYVKDVVEVMWRVMRAPAVNGIFNLGTGRARSWNDLARATFAALDLEPVIEYIEMPEALRDRYQYFTEARMEKLAAAGVPLEFRSLEDGVRDYVAGSLNTPQPYL